MKILSFPRRAPNHRAMRARKTIRVRERCFPFCLEEEDNRERKTGVHPQKKRPGKLAQKPPETDRLRKGSEILLARQRPACAGQLLAQTKAFDNLAIPIRVTTVKIIQQPPALVDHHDQPASRRVVLEVRLQMRRQIVDSLAQ